MRDLNQNYGPLLDHIPELERYLDFSERAFVLTSQIGGNDPETWSQIEARVFQLLMLHALNTSYSIRLLTSYGQSIEAYALLRVRLEQVILASYLVHAGEEDGIIPYIQDINRTGFRAAQALDQDAELRDLIKSVVPGKFEFAKTIAKLNEKSIDPDFDIDHDKIERSWTRLNTHDLAMHRDRLVPADDSLMSVQLRRYYLTLYKSASIIVHSETGALTENFLTVHEKGAHPSPQLMYTFINLINCVHFDILQCYEILYEFDMDSSTIVQLDREFKKFLEDQLS